MGAIPASSKIDHAPLRAARRRAARGRSAVGRACERRSPPALRAPARPGRSARRRSPRSPRSRRAGATHPLCTSCPCPASASITVTPCPRARPRRERRRPARRVSERSPLAIARSASLGSTTPLPSPARPTAASISRRSHSTSSAGRHLATDGRDHVLAARRTARPGRAPQRRERPLRPPPRTPAARLAHRTCWRARSDPRRSPGDRRAPARHRSRARPAARQPLAAVRAPTRAISLRAEPELAAREPCTSSRQVWVSTP